VDLPADSDAESAGNTSGDGQLPLVSIDYFLALAVQA
jgi:hypothetical protein